MTDVKIARALLSVSDKTGLAELGQALPDQVQHLLRIGPLLEAHHEVVGISGRS